ncbi:MAG: hypothetical protein ABL901_17680 [Hyphomicrobiaceae bacterium]
MGMDVEAEIGDLKRRICDLEETVNGMTKDLACVGPELVALRDAMLKRFDLNMATMDRLVNRLDFMNTQVWSLRDDMPTLMADALAATRKRLD